MKVREVVEIVLQARRLAKRIDQRFVLDEGKLVAQGFTPEQIAAIRFHTAEIENHNELLLASLDR